MGTKLNYFILIFYATMLTFRTNCRDSSNLLLRVLPEHLEISHDNLRSTIEVQLINRSDKKYIIYGFMNNISHISRGWSHSEEVRLNSVCGEEFGGLSMLVYNNDGVVCASYMSDTDDFNSETVMSGPDSIQDLRNRYAADIVLDKKRLVDSRLVIEPSGTITVSVDISFQEYQLEKGSYRLGIAFAQYEQFFSEFSIPKEEQQFYIGCIESKIIDLVVK